MNRNQQMINDRYVINANIGADKNGYFLSIREPKEKKNYYAKLIRIDDNHLSAQDLYGLQMRTQRLARFSHTNIISMEEAELTPEGLLLRQTEIPGGSLKNLMQKQGRPLPMGTAYRVALDLASALAALHSEDLVHGELDPSHVWIDDRGKNYLSFLALPPAFDMDRPIYRIPELTSSPKPRIEADIFAFGVLMLEMCTGLSAYRSSGDATELEAYSHVFAYYRECLTAAAEETPSDILPVIGRCLTDNPAQRYKNGEELYWAIRGVIEKKPAAKPEQPAAEPAPPVKAAAAETVSEPFKTERKKGPSFLPILLLGILLIGAGAYMWLKKPDILPKINSSGEETPEYEMTLSVLYATQTAMKEDNERKASIPTDTPTAVPTETATPAPTNTLPPRPIALDRGKAITWNADGSEMAAIPASSFTMGMDHTFLFDPDGILPKHRVSLDDYWIDRAEITQAQYALCVADGVCQPVERIADEWMGDDLPILNVRWADAVSYCAWAGKRLPSEAEWEKAARGDDSRLYPWGNFSRAAGDFEKVLHSAGTDGVDVSPYGVLDMGGNAAEWVNDFYSATRVITEGEMINPSGPISGNTHTVKGGSFLDVSQEGSAFVFNRSGMAPDSTRNLGFRCVVSAGMVDTTKAVEQKEHLELAGPVPMADRPEGCTYRARFVDDVTIPDGTPVRSGERITKTWRLENYGTCPWMEDFKVVWSDANYRNEQQLFDIGVHVDPGEQGEISVTFPVQGSGSTHISFLLASSDGETFGLGDRGRGDLYIEYNVQ